MHTRAPPGVQSLAFSEGLASVAARSLSWLASRDRLIANLVGCFHAYRQLLPGDFEPHAAAPGPDDYQSRQGVRPGQEHAANPPAQEDF